MDLDNGLILHTKEPVDFPKELNINDWWQSNGQYHYGICYWRKCWNIRREVAYIIEAPLDYVAKYSLDISEVKNIWRAINELNSKRAWESGESIWSYNEIRDHLDRDLLRLEWLIDFMRDHECQVEFYDSY